MCLECLSNRYAATLFLESKGLYFHKLNSEIMTTNRDILAAAYALRASKGRRVLPKHGPLHVAIYKSRELFNDLFFNWDGPHPVCDEIDEINASLASSGLVETILPSLRKQISADCDSHYERRIKPSISETDLGKISVLVYYLNR